MISLIYERHSKIEQRATMKMFGYIFAGPQRKRIVGRK